MTNASRNGMTISLQVSTNAQGDQSRANNTFHESDIPSTILYPYVHSSVATDTHQSQPMTSESWLHLYGYRNLVNSSSFDRSETAASNWGSLAVTRTIELLGLIYFPITSYLLPLAIALATVNNVLVLYVMLQSKRYKELTSKNVRCVLRYQYFPSCLQCSCLIDLKVI